jgi:hypothetical protein
VLTACIFFSGEVEVVMQVRKSTSPAGLEARPERFVRRTPLLARLGSGYQCSRLKLATIWYGLSLCLCVKVGAQVSSRSNDSPPL